MHTTYGSGWNLYSGNEEILGHLHHYSNRIIVYIVVIAIFFHTGIYKNRHDFWEETFLIFKSIIIALILVLSILALSKSIENYSRIVIVFSFIVMTLIIPTLKYILKKKLSVFGLWEKKAEVVSYDSDVIQEIFENKYLGYVKSPPKTRK